jgi:hypothetical protein
MVTRIVSGSWSGRSKRTSTHSALEGFAQRLICLGTGLVEEMRTRCCLWVAPLCRRFATQLFKPGADIGLENGNIGCVCRGHCVSCDAIAKAIVDKPLKSLVTGTLGRRNSDYRQPKFNGDWSSVPRKQPDSKRTKDLAT